MIAKMILVAVAEPMLLLALVLGVFKSRTGPRFAFGIAACVSIVSLLLWVPGLAAQAVVTFMGLMIFLFLRAKARLVARVVFVPLLGIYAVLVVWITALEFQDLSFARRLVGRISVLRERYPMQSVADRLAYESKPSGGIGAGSGIGVPELDPAVEGRLAKSEERFTDRDSYPLRRRWTILARLHTQTNDEFVEASGFGRRRIVDPGAKRYASQLELPDTGPIPLDSEPDSPYDPESDSLNPMDAELAHQGLPAKDELASLHETGMDDFVDPERIGFVQDRDHVAGFQSHRFTKVPGVRGQKGTLSSSWRVVRLELVSLLKHETPVAYLSKNLPQMDELRDAATRSLDEFELASLERLKSSEDVVVKEQPDRIRMLGSLRASRNCVDCHSIQRGELLGALTYELVPARPARKTTQVSLPSS